MLNVILKNIFFSSCVKNAWNKSIKKFNFCAISRDGVSKTIEKVQVHERIIPLYDFTLNLKNVNMHMHTYVLSLYLCISVDL